MQAAPRPTATADLAPDLFRDMVEQWPGAVVMILIATVTATLVTNTGRSAWFVGVLVLMVYLIFAMTLYLLPPRVL